MAEIVGCIVAGTQITGQICSVINEFRTIQQEFSRAPQEIQELMEEILFFGQTLTEIDTAYRLDAVSHTECNTPLAIHILKHCENALEALSDVVSHLKRKLERPKGFKRRAATFEVLWKEKEVKHLEKRLTNSLRLLQIYIVNNLL